MLCWFLPYININQPYVYIYIYIPALLNLSPTSYPNLSLQLSQIISFLKRSLVLLVLLVSFISLHCSFKKALHEGSVNVDCYNVARKCSFFPLSLQLKFPFSAIMHDIQSQRSISLDSRALISVPGALFVQIEGLEVLGLSLPSITLAACAGLTLYQVQNQGVRISVCPTGTQGVNELTFTKCFEFLGEKAQSKYSHQCMNNR